MACDEQWKKASFLQEEDEHDDHHRVQYGFSRLSVCSNYGDEDDDGDDNNNDDDYNGATAISRLSVEETGEDADEEPSDSEKTIGKLGGGERLLDLDSSDSDKDSGFQSLPATPPRRRRRKSSTNGGDGGGGVVDSPVSDGKAYASENEAEKGRRSKSRRRKSRVKREYPRWMGGGHGGGVVVLTKAIGGGKPLCMDMEEVKACKELGFELEPGRVSYSAGSTLDTSSGGNSPISSWRISSPG